MKQSILVLAFLLEFTIPALAQFGPVVHLGGQWNRSTGFRFSPSCGAPNNGGGSNCVRFPDGALLRGFAWNSSSKDGSNDEILWELALAGQYTILDTLQVPRIASSISRQVRFDPPVEIPLGGEVLIYGEGWLGSNGFPAEAHVNLYVDPVTFIMVVN